MTTNNFTLNNTAEITTETVAPLISVCVITYNQADYIAQTLDSILKQKTAFRYEIVIGEDLSKDATKAICETYAERYPSVIRLLETPKNFGGVGNLVRTIKACRGKYVALLEGDDYWTDDKKLEKQIAQLESDDQMTFCFTGRKNFYENENRFEEVDENKGNNRFDARDFAKTTYFHTSTAVFRKPKTDDWFDKLKNATIGDRPLYIALLMESGGYALKLRDVCSVFRLNYGSSFTPTKPIERSLMVAKMYAQVGETYPQLARLCNHHLNVTDYFLLREAYRNKDKTEVKRLARQILTRPTTSWGWQLKLKTALHFFI